MKLPLPAARRNHPPPPDGAAAGGKAFGFLMAVAGAAAYGTIPLFTLPLYAEGLMVDSVLFYRFTAAVLVLGAVMLWRRVPFAVAPRELAALAVAGLIIYATSRLLFLSYRHMDAGVASTILFVYPVMVAVIMATCFREKPTWTIAGGIALSLAGIFLLYRGGGGERPLNGTGVAMVLSSALAFSVFIIWIKKSSLKGMPGDRMTFYVLLLGLLAIWGGLGFGTVQPMPSWTALGNTVALGVVSTVVSFVCTALAIRHVGPTPTAIFGVLEPVTAVAIGVAVFGEPLTARLVAGIATILLAVLLVVAGNRRRAGEGSVA